MQYRRQTALYVFWNAQLPEKQIIWKYRNQLHEYIVEKKPLLHKDIFTLNIFLH